MTVAPIPPPSITTRPRSGTSFTKEPLQEIPNARDVWAAMSQAPGFQMQGFDVGGSHTGTQTGYIDLWRGRAEQDQLEGVNTREDNECERRLLRFRRPSRSSRWAGPATGPNRRLRARPQHQRQVGRRPLHRTRYIDYEDDKHHQRTTYPTRSRREHGRSKTRSSSPETARTRGCAAETRSRQYDINVVHRGARREGRKPWFYEVTARTISTSTMLSLDELAQSKLKN